MLNNIEGYIISVKKYKEKDSIIFLLTSNGIISIFGRSYRNPKSKYHVLNNMFLKINMLGESKNTFKLKEYDILNYRYVNYFNLEEIQIISKIINLIKKNEHNDNEIYEMFEFTLKSIKNDPKIHTKNDFIYYFICKILNKNNIKLDFKRCVRCNCKKNFKTFILNEGGLICNDCYLGEKLKTLEEIKSIRSLFERQIHDNLKIKISEEIKIEIEFLLNETLGVYI